MRVWVAKTGGVYLGAYSVVFADDEAEAKEKLNALLIDNGLYCFGQCFGDTLEEVQPTGAHLLWNGDY